MFTDEDTGNLFLCDTIEYRSGLWLVPGWLEAPEHGYKKPERIIRIDQLQHQREKWNDADIILNAPIPKAVLDGRTAKSFEVIERPNIKFDIPKGVH